MSQLDATPAHKRRRLTKVNNNNDSDSDDGADNDETPRAPSLYNSAPRPRSDASSSNSDLFSERSGASSPTKQLSAMKLHDDGFRVGKLLERPLPAALDRLVKDMRSFMYNVGVISEALKVSLSSLWCLHSLSLAISPLVGANNCAKLQHAIEPSGEVDELLLPFVFSDSAHLPQLPLSEARRIVERANRCELRHEEEASWNASVHHTILLAACQPLGEHGVVDFMSW